VGRGCRVTAADALDPVPEPTPRPALAVAMILNRALTPEEESRVLERVAEGEASAARMAAELTPDAAPAPWEGIVFDAFLGPVAGLPDEAGES